MSRENKNLLKGAREALGYAKGNKKGSVTNKVKIPDSSDVVKVRNKLHITYRELKSNNVD